ncbi:hypothetical protein ANCCEY_11838 [Ancylostoma ceylanicum]|nr:hypothetical protein ANCCEY_11838 [Ancylostoma ceylanicum]EYC04107.1 hypothetical protein Y032_0089g2219 [Ancylostoma ceylanicum]
MRSLICYALAVLTVIYSALPVLSFDKKSDMSEFTSAINGASRLRYGKRSFNFGYPLNALRDPTDYEDPYIYAKRAPLTNKLIQSLNGAERLRFGRK